MELARHKLHLQRLPRRIEGCLTQIGVSRTLVYQKYNKPPIVPGHLLQRSTPHQLLDLLKLARRCYLKEIKIAHSDYGGSHEETVRLNALWSRIRRLFARRGITL